MFEDSVLDNRNEGAGRVLTTMFSFALQVAGVGLLVLLPLIYTQALPTLRIAETPAPPHAPRPQQQVTPLERVPAELRERAQVHTAEIVAPGNIPPRIDMRPDPPTPPADLGGPDDGVLNGIPGPATGRNSVIRDIVAHAAPPPKPDVQPLRPTFRSSNLQEGNLVRRVEPVYPRPAVLARIQGPVLLHAVIDREGRIAQLRAESGNALLISAAMEAVRQWRYRPYILNGSPVEVETQITVNFYLR